MSHSYTLERCTTFFTNILGLIVLVTLSLAWGRLPSFSNSCRALPNSVIYPFALNRLATTIRCHSYWDTKIVILNTRWGRYGLPPTVVSRGNIARPSHLKIYVSNVSIIFDAPCLFCPRVTFPVQWNLHQHNVLMYQNHDFIAHQ
jgi:hypothetical protein